MTRIIRVLSHGRILSFGSYSTLSTEPFDASTVV
jgi:hypothetical protein